MRTFAVVPAALLLLPLAPLPGAEPDLPGWWTTTGLDGDRDGLDDALAGAAGAGRVLVDFAAPPSAAELAALAAAGAHVVRVFEVVPTAAVVADAAALPALAGAPGVVLVEADRLLWPTLDRSGPAVGADVARRDYGLTGKGVGIAILDTGVDTMHPDWQDRVAASYDAASPLHTGVGVLGVTVPVDAPAVPDVTNGHGTHVAGVAAGAAGQSGGRFLGVAPGALVLNIKVFDGRNQGSSSYALEGIDWALANMRTHDLRVLQMSLGGAPTDGTDALSRAIDRAAEKGLLTVASAGNDGPGEGTVGIPGVAKRALTVGAVDDRLALASFSSRGPTPDGRQKPDIVAPGVGIRSSVPVLAGQAQYYADKSGTSQAAPHAAGAAALLLEANASLQPADVKWILTATSRAVGPDPAAWDPGYGWGFLNIPDALEAASDPEALTQDALRARPQYDVPGGPLDGLQGQVQQFAQEVPGVEVWLAAGAGAAAALAMRRRR